MLGVLVVRPCGHCGTAFEPNSGKQMYCSAKCLNRVKYERRKAANPCPKCGGPMAPRNGTSAENPVCRACTLTHGVGRYRKGCRCADCKRANAASQRRLREARKAEGRPLHRARVTEIRACEHCGSTFSARLDMVKSGGGMFCSAECGKRAQGWDGTPRRRFRPSKSLRAFIMERDGGVCQLCLSPVRPDADVGHPRYPHLDHIVPRSRGGADDAGNLRLACAQCNVLRGSNMDWVPEVVEAAS